jgi:uncharacterized caspase-like protein
LRVVYYAGHGVKFDGDNYLLPTDIDLKAPTDLDLGACEAEAPMIIVFKIGRLQS